MRLNAFIAKTGFSSRRNATLLIKDGRVRVNGDVVIKPWLEIGENDALEIDGKPVRLERERYIIFNKPIGVTSTVRDKFASKKVVDYIPKSFGRVYPVGRLDKDSRGLLILTNDGQLCYRATHPKYEIEKEYEVVLRGRVTNRDIEKFKRGVLDGDDILRVKTAKIRSVDEGSTTMSAVICEGKKRHLRRLLENSGFPVSDLKRVRIGQIKLGALREGQFRLIDKASAYRLLGSI